MAGVTVALKDGIQVGDTVHRDALLRLPLAGDIIDAGADAERAVPTPQGWVLLISPALLSHHVLRRQIVRIGEHQGPLTLAELRTLSQRDLQALQEAAEGLDAALFNSIESRGRPPAPGERAAGR